MCNISEDVFKNQVKEIHDISKNLKDNWELCSVQNCLYLKKRDIVPLDLKKKNSSTCNINETEEKGSLVKLNCEEEIDSACLGEEQLQLEQIAYNFEYHVVYSIGYQVPVLYFNAYKTDGSLLSLEELWESVPEHYAERLKHQKWSFITQQEHSLLARPFFQLHPCHTADLMKQVGSTRNYVLSWLTAVAPVVHLNIPLTYAQEIAWILQSRISCNTIKMDADKEIITSAPGKLIVHGEHAVVYGKRALAGSLNIRTFLCLSRDTCSNKVTLNLPDVDIAAEWSLEKIEALRAKLKKVDVLNPSLPTEEHLSLLKEFAEIDEKTIETGHLALVSFLHMFTSVLHKQIPLDGVRVQVGSNLPPGAGLGSSAAYSTCLAGSLLLLSGHITKPDTTDSSEESVWSDPGDLELINKWSFQSEKILHGKPSGIDNSVSTYGGTMIFQHGKITPMEKTPQLDILLTNTKVPRSTKILVAGVAERHKKFPKVIQPILDSIEEITRKCEELFTLMDNSKKDSPEPYADLGELIEVNQNLLAALGVSHPSLTQISEISQKYGLQSKLTGAGGGGCAFTLIPPETKQDVLNNMERDILKAGFDCWKTQIGGKGVTFHHALNNDIKLPNNFHVS